MGFDLLTEYAIPYQHPLAVHFPIVLLLVASVAAVAYAASGRGVWRQAALAFLVLGAAGAYWAQETGETLAHAVEGEPVVDAVLSTHEAMAGWTLRLSLLAAVAFAGATLGLRRRPVADSGARPAAEPLAARLVPLVPTLAATAVGLWTGHLGGVMVWGVPAAAP